MIRTRRRTLAAAAVVLAVLGASGAFLFGGSSAPASRLVPTALARVVRTDVVERQQVSGTLGYSGSYAVAAAGAGVITRLALPGAFVSRGQPLYELDRRPVPLLYAWRPAFRAFALGMGNGRDVRALQQNLVALGFDAGGALRLSGHFDLATLAAVEQWQRSLGLEPSGTLALGSLIFLPGPVRIAGTAAAVGAAVRPAAPILTATDPRPAVLVALDPSSVAQLRTGDHVLVTMPDSSTVAGRVSSIGRIATEASNQSAGQGPSTPTIPVTISLSGRRAAGALDQAPVQVAITVQQARHVLAVPISALLAQPGGGYAVSVVRGRRAERVQVTTGLFDDVAGRVEVSGRGLAAALQVEVPTG